MIPSTHCIRLTLFFLSLPIFLTSCSHIEYYTQAMIGHFKIVTQKSPIQDVIKQETIPTKTTKKLSKVLNIKKFATQELGLPDNGSYTHYVDLNRPYVVWNVVATPELSISPKTWCFLIAGCVNYRGYFSREKAEHFATTLREQGYDVAINGVRAYSTLGWFEDPVLNTMLHFTDAELAGIIFHELSHQLIYVSDDSMFNESFATVVEEEGTRRWLESIGHTAEIFKHETKKRHHQEFIRLIANYRDLLTKTYATKKSENWKKSQKKAIFKKLKEEYRALKITWKGDKRYDNWFLLQLNNAHIASIGTYYNHVPALENLLKMHDYDLRSFYNAVEKIATTSKIKRNKLLSLTAQKEI